MDVQLIHFDEAKRHLALAKDIDEIKGIRDQAEAIRQYIRQQGASLEMQNHCAEIKLRAERMAGEMLVEREKNPGTILGGNIVQPPSDLPKLVDLGISKIQSHRWQLEASVPEELFELYVAEIKARKEELTSIGLYRVARRLNHHRPEIPKEQLATAPTISLASYTEWLDRQPECDLFLTDPPYATELSDVECFANDWLPKALAKVKSTGRAYIFVGSYPAELRAYLNIPVSNLTLANVLVWTYRNTLGPSPTYDYKTNWQGVLYFRGLKAPPLNCPIMLEQFSVQDINAPDARLGDRYHTWQKPDEIAERFIRHSTQEGNLVLDCFAGTGTFLLAAARLGRVARGCDIDEEILDIAIERGCRLE